MRKGGGACEAVLFMVSGRTGRVSGGGWDMVGVALVLNAVEKKSGIDCAFWRMARYSLDSAASLRSSKYVSGCATCSNEKHT